MFQAVDDQLQGAEEVGIGVGPILLRLFEKVPDQVGDRFGHLGWQERRTVVHDHVVQRDQ